MNFINDSNHLDQHFLKDESVINEFIKIANLNDNDTVVEVGPGKAVITKKIAPKVKKLYCIELDTRLKPFLDEVVNKYKNVEIIYDNVLNTYIPDCNKIITALPYSIVEPFMSKMLKCHFEELIMITGSRFADSVKNTEINYLSLMVNCFFEFEKIMDITPDKFSPKPRTMSSMIKLKPKMNVDDNIYNFFRNMYMLKHKKIKNGLIESLIITEFCETQRQAKEIINNMNYSDELLETKFEVCSNEQLLELYNGVSKIYHA